MSNENRLNNNAVVQVSTAYFYEAPIGTERPTTVEGLKTPPAAWRSLGNTSFDNIVGLESEGGERRTLRSLQSSALRESISPRTDSFLLNLLEWTQRSLRFYYGANSKVLEDGAIEIPENPIPTERAFLCVLYDGENVAGFYAAKASYFRGSDAVISSTEELAALPLRVTAMSHASNDSALTIIPVKTVAKTATATAVVDNGSITGIFVEDQGSGYSDSEPPTVTIVGDGTGAQATAVVVGGRVTSIQIESGGTGYGANTTVTIAAPAGA